MVAFRYTIKDGTELLFREPGPKDAPQLMRFINTFVSESKSGLLINKKMTLQSEKAWLKGWLEDIKDRKSVMLLVVNEGMIVGSSTVNRLSWKNAHCAEIGIALSREIRGKGVGEALLTKTIDLARGRMRGLEILHLKAIGYNERALALYKKLEFVEVGRIPRANKEGREYFDDILMIRFL